eukprot:11771194-Alexandrium_andersonii.AAC.1
MPKDDGAEQRSRTPPKGVGEKEEKDIKAHDKKVWTDEEWAAWRLEQDEWRSNTERNWDTWESRF